MAEQVIAAVTTEVSEITEVEETKQEILNENSAINQNNDFTSDDFTKKEENLSETANADENADENNLKQGENNNNENEEDDDNKAEPEQFRKLFIGSLNYITTEEAMREYFGKYGDIVDCVIMKEPKTNKSRGFGFVTYARSSMVDELMKNRPHKLDGRELETKRATPREEAGKPGAELTTKKLFVGAIKEGLTEEHLKEYFTPYGSITDCIVMREKETNKSRGFGFVSFDDYDPVDKIVLEKYHTINGQSVAVKKALPKDQSGKNNNRHNDYDENFNNNYGGNRRNNNNGGGRQMNFASDDFDSFEGFGNNNKNGGGGGGGPMRGGNRYGGRSGGPYGGGRRRNNNNN